MGQRVVVAGNHPSAIQPLPSLLRQGGPQGTRPSATTLMPSVAQLSQHLGSGVCLLQPASWFSLLSWKGKHLLYQIPKPISHLFQLGGKSEWGGVTYWLLKAQPLFCNLFQFIYSAY